MGRRRVILFVVAALWAIVLAPYARALWWLHSCPQVTQQLTMPVEGRDAAGLSPSFGAPRAFGPHEGIDIVADAGTAVLSAANGVIIGNRETQIGGKVLWILGCGHRLYYYAHMRELAPAMYLGRHVEPGERIGSVGNTGNARDTVSHLHFAIYVVESSFYPMEYEAIDPYPLLTAPPG